jgi:hypothetical protein
LSNFDSTCIFTARYTKDTTNITTSPAPTLVDAIVYTDGQSRLQDTERIPLLDPRFSSNWTVLAVARSRFQCQTCISDSDIGFNDTDGVYRGYSWD